MVYIFLAEGFEEIEAISVIDILRRASLDVKTVGVGSKIIKGAHGISVQADIEENEARYDNLEMIALPGGMPGTTNLEKSQIVKELIEKAYENNIYIAAICAAPSILGHLGLLDGKTATCFPGFEGELKGANLSSSSVCVDNNIITSRGPGSAVEFALKLVEILSGLQKAETIRQSLQIPQHA